VEIAGNAIGFAIQLFRAKKLIKEWRLYQRHPG
jgi:hypothetical protein